MVHGRLGSRVAGGTCASCVGWPLCTSRWEELHERRVLDMEGWDEERKRDELAKWNKRKVGEEANHSGVHNLYT